MKDLILIGQFKTKITLTAENTESAEKSLAKRREIMQ